MTLHRLTRWTAECASDIRYALRTWRYHSAFVAVAVLSLAAGIGLNTAVFSVVNTIFLQAIRGVPEPERVATIGPRAPFDTFRTVREHSRTLADVAAWQPVAVNVRYREVLARDAVPIVSDNYFEVLRVKSALGRTFGAATAASPHAGEAVLDHDFWTTRLGGQASVLGDTLVVSGRPVAIVGVAPRTFHGFGPERPILWLRAGSVPLTRDGATEPGWRIFGRLAPDATPGGVTAELQAMAVRDPSLFGGAVLSVSTGAERWSGPVSPEKRIEFLLVVVLPLAVVALVLWIGCSNVANLLLARAASRRRELAIRLAAGASRGRLLRLLLTESLLLAAAGGLVGLLLAAWAIDLVWLALPELPPLAVEPDLRVLLYTAGVSLLATVFFGIAPAMHATRLDVAPLLKGELAERGHTARGARLRRFFLVTQFASSMALLVTAATFVRAVIDAHMERPPALVDTLALARLHAGEVPQDGRSEFWRQARERLAAHPGIVSLTFMPAGGAAEERVRPEGAADRDTGVAAAVQFVDPHYFSTGAIPLLHGTAQLTTSSGAPQAVVNARLARQFWSAADPTGRRLSLGGRQTAVEVAGVVDDDGGTPRVFLRLDERQLTDAVVLIRTAGPSSASLGALHAALLEVTGDRVFTQVSTLREATSGGLTRLMTLALGIAMLVLLLATVGLYGSVSFSTSQRAREIAIRLAVGAPRRAVLRLLWRQAGLVVGGGAVLGLALTVVAYRFMSGLFFATWRLDPVTVAGVAMLLALATAAACYLPGRRALRIDPMHVLRAE